jgi:protein TonB
MKTAGRNMMNTIYMQSDNAVVSREAASKVLRLSSGAGFGVVVTVMLFIFMCSLIAMDAPEITENPIKVIEVVMAEDRTIVEQPEPIEKKPVDPEPLPPISRITKSVESEAGIEIPIAIALGPVIKGIDSGFTSGSAMAIFKVAPEYPRRPQVRGIEGFVD